MREFVFFTLVLLLSPLLRADTVYFKNGTHLECKVIGDTPEGLLVELGNEGRGSMILERDKIERIEYDYDSRYEALLRREKAEGTPLWLAHYELGVWCEEHAEEDEAMPDRALNRYLHCKGQPGVPDEVYLRIGRMYEQATEPNLREAFLHYEEYLKRHPDSAEAASAMERLKDAGATPPPPKPEKKTDGLETQVFRPEKWSNGGSTRTVVDKGQKGGDNVVQEIKYEGGKSDKSAFTLPARGTARDLSKQGAIVLDIFNAEDKPVRIALALQTGNGHEWFESRPLTLKPKSWNLGLRFDLTRKLWKSEKANWRFSTAPDNLNNVRNLVLLVMNGGASGKLYLDHLRFDKAPGGK